MRLINVDDLEDMEIETCDTDDSILIKERVAGRNYIRRKVNNAPTIDAVPVVHGEWEWDEARCIYRCSKCKSPKAREDMDRSPVKEQSFCHNCGARMRKGEK